MIYAIVVYSLSVLLWGIKNYLKEIKLPFWVKAIHLVIAFILFQYYFGNFRTMLWDFFRNGTDSFFVNDSYAFNKSLDSAITISFFLCSFFVAGLSLNIAVRAKSRKLLLMTSPVIVLLTSLDLYKSSIIESGLAASIKTFFVFLIFVAIVLGVINLFYNLNPGKKIFIFPENKDI